jgi:hypothetical protein
MEEVEEAALLPAAPTLRSGKLDRPVPYRFLRRSNFLALRLIWPRKWMKHSFGPWLAAAARRLHHNVLATALANKLARIAWSVLAQDRMYEARVPGTGTT